MASSVIGALRVNLGIDSAAFSNGLKNAQSGLQKFGKLAKTGLIAVGTAAAAAAGGLALAVKGTINAADEMSKAAQKIGVPIEELSRLRYAADLSGVSFESLQTAVGRLSRVMNDAKTGSKEAVDTFSQLGIAATNADGSLKSASQVLAEVSDRFASMPDGAEKTALAMELMGRSGANMIPLLNGGSAALQKLMGEASTFGQVFTQEMGSSAEAFNDNISRLQGTFGNIAAQITQQLLPHLERFSAWLVENAPAITAFAVQAVEAFVSFSSGVGSATNSLLAVRESIRQFGEDIRNTAILVAQFAADLLAAFVALPGQMYQIGVDIMAGLWNGLKAQWESVKASVVGIASSVKDSFKSALGIHSPSTVMHEIGVNIMQGLANGMDSMAGGIGNMAEGVAGSIGNAFSGLGSSLAEAIKGTKEWKDVALDAIRSVASSILSQMNFGGGIFGGLLKGLLGGLVGFSTGGTIMPGGSGGIDSQLVAFRKSPNERVDITKPGQERGGSTHITFGLASDGALNIMPEVRSVSKQESASAAGKVANAVPSLSAQAMEDSRVRRIRPKGAF